MNRKIAVGVIIGSLAGIIDLIPMVIQKLSWDANLSAFTLWVVIGFMFSTSNLRLHVVLKGIIISFLCLLPNLFIIGWKEPGSLIPILVMTVFLGSFVGIVHTRVVKE